MLQGPSSNLQAPRRNGEKQEPKLQRSCCGVAPGERGAPGWEWDLEDGRGAPTRSSPTVTTGGTVPRQIAPGPDKPSAFHLRGSCCPRTGCLTQSHQGDSGGIRSRARWPFSVSPGLWMCIPQKVSHPGASPASSSADISGHPVLGSWGHRDTRTVDAGMQGHRDAEIKDKGMQGHRDAKIKATRMQRCKD